MELFVGEQRDEEALVVTAHCTPPEGLFIASIFVKCPEMGPSQVSCKDLKIYKYYHIHYI